MSWESGHAFYLSDLMSLYGLWVAPLAYLVYRAVAPPDPARAVAPAAASGVALLTLAFAFETLLDPWATGPGLRALGWQEAWAGTALVFVFVLLGDLRVLWLLALVAHPERGLAAALRWAAPLTLLVPVAAGLPYAILQRLVPDLHGQVLWMLYELAFAALCLWLARVWAPRVAAEDPARLGFLRAVAGYSAVYYVLWASADLLIVAAGLDLGWVLRVIPNQLYYGFWVLFVTARFYSAPLVGSIASR